MSTTNSHRLSWDRTQASVTDAWNSSNPAARCQTAEYKDQPKARTTPAAGVCRHVISAYLPVSTGRLSSFSPDRNRFIALCNHRLRTTNSEGINLTLHAKGAIPFTSAPSNATVTICTTHAASGLNPQYFWSVVWNVPGKPNTLSVPWFYSVSTGTCRQRLGLNPECCCLSDPFPSIILSQSTA